MASGSGNGDDMATAKLNGEYATRMCLVGALMAGMAAWFLYDGAIGYPKANEALATVRPALLADCARGITPEEMLEPGEGDGGGSLLKTRFAEAGLTVPRMLHQNLSEITYPEGNDAGSRGKRTELAARMISEELFPRDKRAGQFAMAGVMTLFAILAFAAVIRKRGVEFTADGDGLGGNGIGPAPVAWSDISSVDWSRWDSKGIVTVKTSNGRRISLDGWHFKGIRGIAAEIERHFPRG